jgi:hypothetical protein
VAARDEHADVVGAVLVDPARAVEPQHLPGRGRGDHHIADVVDRGDQTRQLDDVGPVAIEDQDISVQDNVPTFFWEFLANPISLVLSVAVILLLLNQTPFWPRRRKAAGQEA